MYRWIYSEWVVEELEKYFNSKIEIVNSLKGTIKEQYNIYLPCIKNGKGCCIYIQTVTADKKITGYHVTYFENDSWKTLGRIKLLEGLTDDLQSDI